MSGCFLGIDVGSISTNIVAVDARREVLFASYGRGEGNPIASVQQGLGALRRALPASTDVDGVCVTGSGRALIGTIVGADIIKNEITAHARAALFLRPDVRTIFEIGGQDSKVTVIRDGVVVDFAMNLVCAAGTGSFLDSQAKRLNISIEELGERATRSRTPTSIAGRCTVFAESDMIHKQQCGHAQDDILMGLCHAMVRNYLSNVCKGKEIRPPIAFQGGVSANTGIQRAFREALDGELVVPEHNMVMGAFGAALIAADARLEERRFRGFELADEEIRTRSFACEDCSNGCEVVEISRGDVVIGKSGGRCGKWESDERGVDGGLVAAPRRVDPVVACSPERCGETRRPPAPPRRRLWSYLLPRRSR